MSKRLVIFGDGDIAQLAHFYFTRESEYAVEGFTIDAAYMTRREFCGLPVVPFEDVSDTFAPRDFELFVALGYAKLNAIRKEKYLAAKARGYRLATFVSPAATVRNERHIGDNCFILEDNTIQPFVRIGNNITLWSGNHIGHHTVIADHCFISSHVVVSGGVQIGEQCFVGVNATLRDHIKVGPRCVIGAGALLLSDSDADGVYIGPATGRSKVPSNRLRNI